MFDINFMQLISNIMKHFLFIFITCSYLSGVAQQEKPCKDISFKTPQKATPDIDNGYRADSCEYHCLCEPQSVDGEKHFYFYDQFGRDTSTWNLYQDTIIDPWYLESKDTKEYTSFNAIQNEKGYWYDTLGMWQYTFLRQNTFNTSQEMIHQENYRLYESTLPHSISDFTYGPNGLSQSLYFVAYPTYPATLRSKQTYFYNLSGNLSYIDYYSYNTQTSTWSLPVSYFYSYDSLENLIQYSYFSYSSGVPVCNYKEQYEYDGNGNMTLKTISKIEYGSPSLQITKTIETFYNTFNKPDSAITTEYYMGVGYAPMLEKYYYDSLGNQIRWEYYLTRDSAWQIFGWEDCYYSQHIPTHGISEPATNLGFTVFPNPCADIIQISSEEAEVSEITIMDLRGIELMTLKPEQSNQVSANISALSNGMYFIRCTAENGKSGTKTIVVQR